MSDCIDSPYSLRTCERGTNGCNVKHNEEPPDWRTRALAAESARGMAFVCVSCGLVTGTATAKCACGAARSDMQVDDQHMISRPSGLHTVDELIGCFATSLGCFYQPNSTGPLWGTGAYGRRSPAAVVVEGIQVSMSRRRLEQIIAEEDAATNASENYLRALKAESTLEEARQTAARAIEALGAERDGARSALEEYRESVASTLVRAGLMLADHSAVVGAERARATEAEAIANEAMRVGLEAAEVLRNLLQRAIELQQLEEKAEFAAILGPLIAMAQAPGNKAPNYVAGGFVRGDERWSLTLQREGGKTPGERLNELTAERDAATADAVALRAALSALVHHIEDDCPSHREGCPWDTNDVDSVPEDAACTCFDTDAALRALSGSAGRELGEEVGRLRRVDEAARAVMFSADGSARDWPIGAYEYPHPPGSKSPFYEEEMAALEALKVALGAAGTTKETT